MQEAARSRPVRIARAAARVVVIVVFLAPLLFMVTGSLRKVGAPPSPRFEVIPTGAGLGAYGRLSEHIPIWMLARNSLLVVAVAVPVTVLVATWAGFAIVQMAGRSRRAILVVTLTVLMIPIPMLWTARFIGFLRLGLLDTLIPVMAPALAGTTPFTILLAYWAFRRVPPQLFQAARLEGASAFQTWWRVGMPLIRATTLAIAAVAFTVHWGNYLDAFLFISEPGQRTLPLGVARLSGLDPSELPIMLAGAVLLTVPPVLALFLAQRRLLSTVDLAR